MTRNCIAMPIAFTLIVLAAGCGKENLPPTQASHTRNRDSAGTTNLNFHLVEEWLQAPTPTATLRMYAIGFSIGSKGYMGGGEGYLPKRGVNVAATLNDFWQFDPSTSTWTQMASMLSPIEQAATFVIGTQGYVGTGYSYNRYGYTLSNALYQYDQASNTWTQKSSLPAAARCSAVGTSISNEGYIGTGNDLKGPFYSDWWQYDPPTDHWTEKANLPGQWGRADASSFSIEPYGFVTCGSIYVANGTANDLWRYDPAFNSWMQEASLPAAGRIDATGFNYGSYGALTCGSGASGLLNDFWYYNLATNTWHSDLNMGGGARGGAVGFAINGTPYVGTGYTASSTYNSDFWYLTYVLL